MNNTLEQLFLSKNPVALECSTCEDRDCQFNAEGLCYNIATILENVPSGMFTCSDSFIEFVRNDYIIKK